MYVFSSHKTVVIEPFMPEYAISVVRKLGYYVQIHISILLHNTKTCVEI